jgi:hypothetical protein
VLSALLILLGGVNILRGVAARERVGMAMPALWPLASITIGIVGFGVLIEPTGLLPATLWLVLFACLGGRRFHLREAVIIYAVVSLMAALIFVTWLRLPALHLIARGF